MNSIVMELVLYVIIVYVMLWILIYYMLQTSNREQRVSVIHAAFRAVGYIAVSFGLSALLYYILEK